MSRFRRGAIAVVLATLAPLALAARSIAPPTPNAELLQTHQTPTHLAVGLWLAPALFTDPASGLAPQLGERLVHELDGYQIVGILSAHYDAKTTSIVSDDRAALRASVRLQLADGSSLAPLSDADIPVAVRGARDAIGPYMSHMLGKFGDALQFVVFRDADAKGHSRLDAYQRGELTLTFGGERFHWDLPLASLLPLRRDPETGDTFPGDFEYSPFTGHKLVLAP